MNEKAKHALRIVVGLYLAYLGWQLFDAVVIKGTGNGMMGAFLGPVFLIVGLMYAGYSIRKVLVIRKEEQYDTPDSIEDDMEEDIEEEVKSDTDNDERITEDISGDADSENEEAVEAADVEER